MPELPEVETLCRQLEGVISGAVMEDITILDARLGHPVDVKGRRVRSVERRGKYLLMRLDTERVLHLHLRMSGRLLWCARTQDLPAHSRFVMRFPGGNLVCVDPRRFATLAADDPTDRSAPVPDPLHAMDASVLRKAARGRRAPVKSFLLDQAVIAGIGNIYACETLHRAAVNPWQGAGSLTPAQWRRIARAGRQVLRHATRCRGTSVSDWHDLYGEKGTYQHHLAVYNRTGLPCPRCGAAIQRGIISGRGTWYCAACQS